MKKVPNVNAVIFDLDGTLINTDCLQAYRDSRDWAACKRDFGKAEVYAGIADLWKELKAKAVKVAVFTKTPSTYAEGILRHHGLPYDKLVAWHDVVKKKPDGEGVEKILAALKPDHCIGIGDDIKDAGAYANGGVPGYCAAWNPSHVQDKSWAAYLKHPSEVLSLLKV